MEQVHALEFFVNGKKVTEDHADPEMTLLFYLRNKLQLPGTKLGCGEGGCGACTVMISRFDRSSGRIVHMSANACLAPLCAMHGTAVTTVEGIGSTKTRLHPVQERIAKSFGSQCGFCTPGIVMSMYTLLRNNCLPTREEMESTFEGNLCRCTGYRPILDGFNSFTKEFQCGMGDQCCRNGPTSLPEGKLFDSSTFSLYDPSQEPIFPSELQLSDKYDTTSLYFAGERVQWFRPVSLTEILALKAKYPEARLVIGNTEVGVEVKLKNMYYPVLIASTHVPELTSIKHETSGIRFGASTTLTDMENVLREAITEMPEHKTRIFTAINEMLRWFAGHQIRNVAAVGGNIMTASPISDLNPLFLSAGCTLQVASKDSGTRTVCMDKDFFLGYRKTAIKLNELLVSVHIPFTKQNEYFAGYKQAQRREDDISIVNAGMRVVLSENSNIIQELALSFGGMAPVTKMATRTAQALVGRKWDEDMLNEACRLMVDDLPLPPGSPGGMETYRKTLTTSFFFKFYLTVQRKLAVQVPKSYLSASEVYQRNPSKGIQLYEAPNRHQDEHDAVGRPMVHRTALQQATGEAQYIDDIPCRTDEFYLALVTSTKAKARLLAVDPKPALAMTGVKTYVSMEDVPGGVYGRAALDAQAIFATDNVTCEGHVIGAIVADTQVHAQRAAKTVCIKYEESEDPIITIEQAIAANSFHPFGKSIKRGDPARKLQEARHVLEGEVRIGGQEHFYLETQATLAVPRGEDGEMEVYCSCQAPAHAQKDVAAVLGVPANRITIRTKRLGGGFGGKETQFNQVLLPAAVAAYKLNKPVRCMLDRDEDMVITGTRHPFLGRYKVGFDDDGHILAAEFTLFSNAGNTLDLSPAVMERALFHIDNAYRVPHLHVSGHLCKTNISSNTAFRGFGGPQGMFVTETVLSEIALKLNKNPEQIRQMNIYEEGDATHFGQKLENCNIRRCWDEVLLKADVDERRKDIEQFNRENRWKKRGLCVVPTKFGINFTLFLLNQAGALVHVYTDGSVLVAHGGTEMGQGLHTKMIQIASRALGVPVEKIHISETNTGSVPNASATAASASSDLNGMAVLNACKSIMDKLKPLKAKRPQATWEELVLEAYESRISLFSSGFFSVEDINFDWDKSEGRPFNYFTFGAACSEVEIDCLTGDHTVLRTDIVMDLGQSLNPAIDIGQIEGGFMQGYGLFTLEFQRYSPKGFLYSRGPGSYKIPGFGDIPIQFNVSLLKESKNEHAVYSSKAIGEPPLFLAASVFFAIKEAVVAARLESKLSGPFRLDSPATAWRVRMACEDRFTNQFPEADPATYTPWDSTGN